MAEMGGLLTVRFRANLLLREKGLNQTGEGN